jgi:hypothetical protein
MNWGIQGRICKSGCLSRGEGAKKQAIKLNTIDVCRQAKNDASPRSVYEQCIEGGVSGKSRLDGDMIHGG